MTTPQPTPAPQPPHLLSALADLDAPAAEEVTLPGQRTRVILADGRSFVVRVSNRDYVAFDLTRARHRWPAGQEAPFLFASFLAWSAARRAGLFDGTFDGRGGFTEVCEDVSPLEQEDDDAARPTRRAAADD